MLIAAATVLPARVGFVLLIAAFLAVLVLAPLTAVGLATLGALSGHGLGEMLRMSTAEQSAYQQYMVVLGGGLQHGHSLWGLLRLPGYLQGVALETWQTRAYAVLAAVIFRGIAVHVVFREREPWKQVLLATVPAVLLPFVSVDYKSTAATCHTNSVE